MTSFSDYFWGEKNSGFDVLYHNMKHGQESSKEFADFLRESCAVEESYAKLLAKLAKSASNWGSKGSFGPFWQVLRGLAEKLSNIHLQLVHAWADLIKDVHRYADDQSKKHKAVKDQEAGTQDTVATIQATVVALKKAKETYHARCVEYEKLKRDSMSQKDMEKAEAKYRKANDEYKAMIDKYANVRNEFETKMLESCKHFQELEEYHLQQMKDFVDTYAKAWEHQHVLLGQVHKEFVLTSADLTVERLVDMFVKTKTTGREVPAELIWNVTAGPIEFEEADLSNLPPAIGTPDSDKRDFPVLEKPKKEAVSGESSSQGSPDNQPRTGPISLLDRTLPIRSSHGWFLNRRRKDKKKKKKDKDKADGTDTAENTPKVDDEGFSIRPDNPLDSQNDNNSWYSSSDSDSDGDERRKIKVEIKPFSPNGNTPQNNVDDIKKSIEGLRLSPTSNRRATPTMLDQNMKRSVSVSDTISGASTKPSQDLLGLDIFTVTAASSASTPTGGLYGLATAGRGGVTSSSAINTPVSTPMEDYSRSDTPPTTLGRHGRSVTPTIGSAPLLPGPPIRRTQGANYATHATARPPGRQSPAFLAKTDSVPSLSGVPFTTAASNWSSRGPSPLTIGLADTVPLAVSFSETVNAYFKGSDEAKCRVKVTGDMMMSFPAGIVRVFTENPSPAPLCFKVKNTGGMEQLLANKQLVTEDLAQSAQDYRVYTFDMSALTDLLRKQSEQNRTASYFNIDILKYQVRTKPGSQSVPLHLVSYWKCESSQTDFRLDYRYNGAALAGPRVPLTSLNVLVPVSGGVTKMQSKPSGDWSSDSHRAVWRISDLSDVSEGGASGCIRAKFDLTAGPSIPATVAAQFLAEGATLSGVGFDLAGPGYRVSLVKKRFITGKYISEQGS